MEKNDNSYAYNIAYAKIKEMLFNLKIKPGDNISELMLSKELGLSRTPIREAMRTLEQEGLIVSINGRKKAPSFTLEDIQQIFELKLSIEGDMIKFATNRQTVLQKREMIGIRNEIMILLNEIKNSLDDKIKHDNIFHEWDKLDHEFHRLIYNMARNPRASDIINNLNLQWHRFRMGICAMENRLEKNMEEHIEMANLIILNKPDEAKQKMLNHIKDLYEGIICSSEVLLDSADIHQDISSPHNQ